MSLPKPPKRRPSKAGYSTSAGAAQNRASQKANNELLFKGILCSLIGLGVLISPYFITSPGMQGIVAQSSLVGWFALVLGVAFIGVYAWRRLASAKKQ
ncbi:hypothetical protein [Polaromonas jejuensis]|uniref:LPXTG cell wall anchor domain-containing protein n=1 Tax=Polaromonas jejuensis TaxID=457502 RepID=A0ABW0Q4E6_9BURK|nr:hypothetical protein [Polaromonas jejuensis]